MNLSYNFNDMKLHSIGIRIQSDLPSTIPQPTTSANEFSHNGIPLSCLDAGKSFLDKILAMPLEKYCLVSFIEWIWLPYALLRVSELSFPSEDFASIY